MDKAITYGELDDMSRDFAAWLQGTGLKFGDRVAIMMPNVLQYPVATAGILRAGMTVVNVNPLYTPRELEHQLNDSGAEAIVILENFATTLREGAQEHAREARRPRQHGRPARLPEGRDRQPGRAQGEEDGAGLCAAAGGAVQDALAAGTGKPLATPRARARRRRLPAVHRRHDGRLEGRDAAAPQHRGERAAERCLAAARAVEGAEGRAADDRHGAAALSHLRAHGLLPARDARRRACAC